MKTVGVLAIVAGVLVILLGLVAASTDVGRVRAFTASGIILLAAGLILCRRARRRPVS